MRKGEFVIGYHDLLVVRILAYDFDPHELDCYLLWIQIAGRSQIKRGARLLVGRDIDVFPHILAPQ